MFMLKTKVYNFPYNLLKNLNNFKNEKKKINENKEDEKIGREAMRTMY